MSTFSLKIVACNKVFYDGECEILIYPAYDGQMAIMANHEQMTSTVEIGEIKFKLPDGTWMNAIVSDGLVEVDHNKVDVWYIRQKSRKKLINSVPKQRWKELRNSSEQSKA